MDTRKGVTTYSREIKGAAGNYNWSAYFDHTDGYIGIRQHGEAILLSPAQVKALLAFVTETKRSAGSKDKATRK